MTGPDHANGRPEPLPLFDVGPYVEPAYRPAATIQERFIAFHEANGWVYEALVRLAKDMRRRGRTKAGIKQLVEVVRWEYRRSTTGEDLKINNSFTSRYARLVMEQNPDLAGMFEIRELRAA